MRKQSIPGHFSSTRLPCYHTHLLGYVTSGPEPAILDWYGHCVPLSVNKLGGSLGNVWKIIGTLRSLLRPCLGQNATRISPPVVSVARKV